MSRWTIEEPTTLDFDGVVALRITLIAGSVSVLASDERPSIMVGDVEGPPLVVTHEAGMLTVTHEKLWEGVLTWLRTHKARAAITVTVPHDCPVSLNLVSADAVVTGMTTRTSIKSASGDVTLDGVAGAIDANTVSGVIEAQGLDGTVSFTSVSGDLSLAGATVDRLGARTVSGRIAADLDLGADSAIDVNTVSGEVALRVPESAGAQVTLSSAAGRIETSFPELGRQDRTIAQSVSGKLGDGAGRLTVNTVSGAVTLLGRDDDPEITTGPRMEK
ncbi:DUF4097 family beta strand repeat protein [Actinomadura sp. NAK00032]|uniref:DUF4097 family beta strand repeat-containing protein n=1 Tax=Actinomadura sp. NAK00032 TaxID=2742128 RepID=UPI0015927CA6|nr:DUF4097 family beta strand repeat-containing protein [Actinomadura sp. NAK00032]QKW34527.1 DUF4097 family beta strand repeat protein [Actinomadura sp. NAK00032]